MITNIINLIESFKNFLWSGPLLIILFLVGIHQTFIIRGLQFRSLFQCLALTFFNHLNIQSTKANSSNISNLSKVNLADPNLMEVNLSQDQSDLKSLGDLSAFEAMMTALAGSIGTGNIAGISTAIAVGGVGSLFWMWVVAAVGMATAYAETVLSIKYRIQNSVGDFAGGPMYYLRDRLKLQKTANFYAVLVAIVAITLGCLVQSHSVVDAITGYYPINKFSVGIILTILTGLVIVGGVKSIGKVASILVPFMAIGYLLTGMIILIYNYQQIIPGLGWIIKSAFIGQAPIGGFLGSTIWLAIQNGAQYGIFANEAGLGSLAIAAASAKTNSGVEQGMRSVAGVFIATMIICTITGLVVVVTGVVGSGDLNGLIKGSRLVMLAFSTVHSKLNLVVIYSLVMFAFTTILAWAYYGEKSIEYLYGIKFVNCYRWFFTGFILVGSCLHLDVVWSIANLSTALMSLPNLIGIMLLYQEVQLETKKYFA